MRNTEIEPDIDNEEELTAYHEAAHFVMGRIARGGLPRRISIVPDPEAGYLGTCGGGPSLPTAETLFAMAGVVFEEYYAGAGGYDDLSAVTTNLEFLYGDEADTQYGVYFSFTAKLMSYAAFRKAWRLTAERLLLLKELDQEQIYDLAHDADKAMGKWFDKLRNRVGDFLSAAPELSPQQMLVWHVQRDDRHWQSLGIDVKTEIVL